MGYEGQFNLIVLETLVNTHTNVPSTHIDSIKQTNKLPFGSRVNAN